MGIIMMNYKIITIKKKNAEYFTKKMLKRI